jgi:dGTPase
LTHTLEVSQIARTIARALNLNEDLTEAMCLAHDMGHTPFGHVGEHELDRLYPAGFKHAEQSLRIVDQIENEGEGLNLTWEVRQGIAAHSKPRGDFLDPDMTEGLTLEAQICRVSDALAYLNHDLADAFRASVLEPESLPVEVAEVLGSSHSRRIDTMVADIVESSWSASGLSSAQNGLPPVITMSPHVKHAVITLREFMFEKVYVPEDRGKEGDAARRMVRLLYCHFSENKSQIPAEYGARSKSEERAVVDYVSGMTDRYAIRMAESIQPGIGRIFHERLV